MNIHLRKFSNIIILLSFSAKNTSPQINCILYFLNCHHTMLPLCNVNRSPMASEFNRHTKGTFYVQGNHGDWDYPTMLADTDIFL